VLVCARRTPRLRARGAACNATGPPARPARSSTPRHTCGPATPHPSW
jgi:hypothetical protein